MVSRRSVLESIGVMGSVFIVSSLNKEDRYLPDTEFLFNSGRMVSQSGIITFPIETNSNGRANVRVGDSSVSGYEVEAILDSSSDFRTTLRFNAYLSGFDPLSAAYTVQDPSHSVNVSAATDPIGEPLATGTYGLELVEPSSEETVELSSFEVIERESGIDMTLWMAGKETTFEGYNDIVESANDRLSELSSNRGLTIGEQLVVQIDVTDFAGVFDAANTGDRAALLVNLIRNGHLNFVVEQQNPGLNRGPKRLDVQDTAENASIYYNISNAEIWIVGRTGEFVFEQDSQSVQMEVDDTFAATVEVTDPFVARNEEVVSQEFSVIENETLLKSPRDIDLSPQVDQTITGRSTLAPGTRFEIEIRGPNFINRRFITVENDGTFGATVDLSDLSAGDELSVSLSNNGSELAAETYTIGSREEPPMAAISFSDQESPEGEFIVIDSVELSDGGFVALHEDSTSGPIIGFSSYRPEGRFEDIVIRLDKSLEDRDTTLVAVAYLDTNDNDEFDFPDADEPYTEDGDLVSDSASISVSALTTTTTTTTTIVTDTTSPTTSIRSTTTVPTTTVDTPTQSRTTRTSSATTEPTSVPTNSSVALTDDQSPVAPETTDQAGDTGAGNDALSLPFLGGVGGGIALLAGGLYWWRNSGDDGRTNSRFGDGAPHQSGSTTTVPSRAISSETGNNTPISSDQSQENGSMAGSKRHGRQSATETADPEYDPQRNSMEEHSDETRDGISVDTDTSTRETDPIDSADSQPRTANFVENTAAVDSATQIKDGIINTFRGDLDNGHENVLFYVLGPEYDTQATREAFNTTIKRWDNMDQNPHIATIEDYGTRPRPWAGVIVSDQTVADLTGPIDPELRDPLVTGVNEAVRSANLYSQNHFGLEPEHVHLRPNGQPPVVVSDWGLTMAVSEAAGNDMQVTPYTAPEQLSGQTASTTEVYRIAAVLYRALTGHPPVESRVDQESAIKQNRYTSVTNYTDTLSEGVDNVLSQALAADPAVRHDSPYKLRQALLRELV